MTRPRVLVIDDEPQLCRCLTQWLQAEGFECACAPDADTGFAYLQSHQVDLVTLDNQLPRVSGFEMLARLSAHAPEVSVLMVTAELDIRKAIHAMTLGALGYVIKPVRRDDLLAQVRNALERRRLSIENRELTKRLRDRIQVQTCEIRSAHEETIYRLVKAVGYRDEETGDHVQRTGLYSEVLAATIGWTAEEVDLIRLAAPMHDIGKIGIPDAILCKRGGLTAAERSVMETHTLIGGQMLDGSVSLTLQMARDIALTHHENWDGSGYPRSLAGEAIPTAGRIVAIVDVFDALSHDRVYRPAFEDSDVERMMWAGRGTKFDPQLLDAFMSLRPEMWAIAGLMADEQGHLTTHVSDNSTNSHGCQEVVPPALSYSRA